VSEPPEIAADASEVVPGVWHWRVHNSRLGGSVSSCQLLAANGEVVLVDPIRLDDAALAELPAVTAICLTAKCHQRSAWRYRDATGAPVWAPDGTAEMEQQPDHRYVEGELLPGGLRALRTPGPEPVHYCLLAEAQDALISSDLLMRGDDGSLRYVPLEYHDDPAATRASVAGLLEHDFSLLLLDHGAPLAEGKAAIRALLAGDTATA
jgi:glyoxylase-like metal-dependent hydrolase (beta-lactamase superfamily II)